MFLLLLACKPVGVDLDDTSTTDSADTSVDSEDPCLRDLAPVEPAPADTCPPIEGGLHLIEEGTFWLSQPFESTADTQTLVFLGGGGADQNSVQFNIMGMFANDERFQSYRVVAPYVGDSDRAGNALDALAATQDCFGGDPNRVHLFGHSSGGYVAFELGLDERFATLSGFPALFPDVDDEELVDALECVPVLNAAGAEDSWASSVEDTHERLDGLGLDSTLILFEGQGHVPDPEFDPAPLFDWLESH